MHISQSVEILVFVEHCIGIFFVFTSIVHEENLSLALLVFMLEFLILTTLILDSLDKFTLHRRLTWKVSHAIIVFLVRLCIVVVELLRLVFIRANERLSTF